MELYSHTALLKLYESIIPYIKTIQKAVESLRISDEKKEYLKSLKIKNNYTY